MTSKIFHFSKEELDNKVAQPQQQQKQTVEAAFELAFGNNWGQGVPVKVPGAYNVWASGTTGDVTLLCWIHQDGSTTCKAVIW